jgi:hypothetical protein
MQKRNGTKRMAAAFEPNSEVEPQVSARSAAFRPLQRACCKNFSRPLFLPGLKRRERRAPAAASAIAVLPTSGFRFNLAAVVGFVGANF